MKRRRSLHWVAALVLAAAGAPAHAQDSLDSIIKSATISRGQRATMEAEVSQRVRRLADAGANDSLRADFKEKLIRTAQTKGASAAGLDAYAEICAGELTPLVTNNLYGVAQDAVQTLNVLDNASTVPAFAAALSSDHAAIRLMAARGIQNLHAKLSKRQGECEEALSALGKAGAVEQNEYVLRVIYQAINFPIDVPNFKFMDPCAAALNTVLAGRLQKLASGSRDQQRDAEGLAAAAACYAGAGKEQKARLIGHMVEFLQSVVDRYLDPDIGEESLPALATTIDRIETVIYGMMNQSNVTPPATRISTRLKGKISDRKKLETEVRSTLNELFSVLEKDPWKVP